VPFLCGRSSESGQVELLLRQAAQQSSPVCAFAFCTRASSVPVKFPVPLNHANRHKQSVAFNDKKDAKVLAAYYGT